MGTVLLTMSGVPHVSWTQLTPANSPLARSSHGVSIVGDTLYMFGGEHSARHPVNNTLYALDLGTPDSAWREVRVTGEIPSPRFGHAQAVMGESIYIFGGREGNCSYRDLGRGREGNCSYRDMGRG